LNSEGHVARGSGGKPVFVTGVEARARGHLLRATADAILVGSHTVRDDNPDLTCRLSGLEQRSPVRIVLNRALDLAPEGRLFSTARQVPVWVVCGFGASQERQERIEATGAHVIRVSEVAGQLWLPSVMEALVERGITRVLVEGGPEVWRSFAAAGLADEAELFMAGQSVNVAMENFERFLPGVAMKLEATAPLGPDTLYSFVKEIPFIKETGRAPRPAV
jgi:diaminohydroxyphosphoribosylaminopyrimidine deaminase / 5-amino-6-(5-phosphoribosylamino)uracil reductase